MVSRALLALAGLLAVACPTPARASGDGGCTPDWTLTRAELDGCSNLPFLSPGNDSRVNLMLLLADQGRVELGLTPDSDSDYGYGYGVVPFMLSSLRDPRAASSADADPWNQYADGEGSRCRSNDGDALSAFLAALDAAKGVPDAERVELARSRRAMLGECDWPESRRAEIVPAHIESPMGVQFADYERGAIAFYDGDFAEALRRFGPLRLSDQPWLRETAVYMVGRTWLNEAQRNAFDEYGYFSPGAADPGALRVAQAALDDYLAAYPSGRYAASARGLLRRVYWLRGDDAALSREYAWLLAHPDSPLSNVSPLELVQEIDNKLLPGSTSIDDPQLLAVAFMMQMRGADDALLERLEARRQVFADQPELYEYLRSAALFYGDGDGEALRNLPPVPPDQPIDYLAFSRETLRGLALERNEQWRDAETVWLGLLPHATRPLQRDQLELALASNYERSGRLDAVFAADSPVRAAQIRRVLLRYAAGPELLRQQATRQDVPQDERDEAVLTLLQKDLLRGRYRDFGTDLALMPPAAPAGEDLGNTYPPTAASQLPMFAWPGGSEDGYVCPPIRDVAQALAKNPSSPLGLNCLGEFVLRQDLDWSLVDDQPSGDRLGSTHSSYWGTPYSRLDGYLKVIDDPKASTNDRAYALYRAVNCFAYSGGNHCGTQEIDEAQRRTWFRMLKRDRHYARTPWADKLKYWW